MGRMKDEWIKLRREQEWRIEQYNRNKPFEFHISIEDFETIEELESHVNQRVIKELDSLEEHIRECGKETAYEYIRERINELKQE